MKRLGITLLATLIITQAEALLPPLYESSAQIKGMMINEQLGQNLQSGELIEKIERNSEGYEITTNKSRIQVNVINEPSQYPGPGRYQYQFQNAIPLSQ